MRTLLLSLTALLLAGCDVAQELTRRNAPAFAYAQDVVMDTAGVTARRVRAEVKFPHRMGDGASDAESVALLPDGRTVVIDDPETADVALYDMETGAIRRLTQCCNGVKGALGGFATSVSADGQSIAYTWYDSLNALQVHALDLEEGTPRILFDDPSGLGWVVPNGWAPDRTRVAAHSWNEEGLVELLVLHSNGAAPRRVRTLDWRAPGRVEFSPDGRYLVYDYPESVDSHVSDLFLIDLETGREHRLLESAADNRLMGWVPGSSSVLFTSDRTGTTGLWVQRVEDGRAVGEPSLVRPDFWRSRPTLLTEDGRFYYTVRIGGRQWVTASLDAGTGAVGASRPVLDESFEWGAAPGLGLGATVSEDGRSVAVTVPRSGLNVVLVRSLGSGEAREYPLPIRVRRVLELHWMADGTAVYGRAGLLEGGPAIFRLDLATGGIELYPVPQDEQFNRFAPLPDGRSALVRRVRRVGEPGTSERPAVVTLSVRNLALGEERELLRVPTGFLFTPSPDGQNVAVVRTGHDGQFELLVLPLTDDAVEPRTIALPDFSLDLSPLRPEQAPLSGHLAWEASGRAVLWMRPHAERGARTLVRIPLDGSPPSSSTVRMAHAGVLGFQLSPTGDRIVYATGEQSYELWVLEGLPGAAATASTPR